MGFNSGFKGLNPGLSSQERHSTWRRLLSPAHWTEIEGRN